MTETMANSIKQPCSAQWQKVGLGGEDVECLCLKAPVCVGGGVTLTLNG